MSVNNNNELLIMTPLERKSELINQELDRLGMGRYQWCIFVLCGFGYFLDLMWAQTFPLIAVPIQQEMGIPDSQIGDLYTAFSVGLTVGAFSWGILVDIIGRWWAFNLTCLIASIFGILFGVPHQFIWLCVIASLIGLGIGGNIPIDATITMEFLPKKNRYLLASLSTFQPIGVVVCCFVAFGLIPAFSCDSKLKSCNQVPYGDLCCESGSNRGWRYLMFTTGGITMCIFIIRFFLFSFQESPKFLLLKGKDKQAFQVVEYIAKFNKQECQLTLEELLAQNDITSTTPAKSAAYTQDSNSDNDNKVSSFILLRPVLVFVNRITALFATLYLARLTITTWLIYITDYWGFSLAGYFLPIIIAKKNISHSTSPFITYRNYIITYSCGIPAVLIATKLIEIKFLGRKWSMVISSALMAVSLILFVEVDSSVANIAFNGLEYFFQSMFNAILYGWTAEAFPAHIRGTACGISSTWGRITASIAPLIGARLLAAGAENILLYIAGGGVFLGTLAVITLPSGTVDKQTI